MPRLPRLRKPDGMSERAAPLRVDVPVPPAAGEGRPAHSGVTVRTLVVSAILVLSIVAAVVILHQLLSIVVLFLIAIVFAEGIRPLVHRMQRLKLHKVLSILVVFVILVAGTTLLIVLLVRPLVTEAESLAGNLPDYQRQLTARVNDIQQRLHLSSDLSGQISNALNTAKDLLLTIGGYIVNFLLNFIVVLVLAFLWLTTSDRLKLFFVDLFPERFQALTADVLRDMGARMGGYLRAVAINALAVGAMSAIACAILGLPSPLLIGVFVGLTSVIPLVGPVLGALPAVLLGFTVGPLFPVVVAVVFIVITLVDGNTVVPMVMNRVLSLPALAVVLALLIGGALTGLSGALLAVPVAAALQVIVTRVLVPAVHQSQGRAGGLSEQAAMVAAATARPAGLPERRQTPRV